MYNIASDQHLSLLCQAGQQRLCMDKTCACHASAKERKFLLSAPTVTANFINLAHELWVSRVARSEVPDEQAIQSTLVGYLQAAQDELNQQFYEPFKHVDLENLTKVMTEIVAMVIWVESEAVRRFNLAMDRDFLEKAIPQH